MSRYIDADNLKERIPKDIHEDVFENCRNCELLDDEQVKELIDLQPTADVRENVRGEWYQDEIAKVLDIYLCSNCNIPTQIVDKDGNTKLTRYCPNCGADMRPITALSKNAEIDLNLKKR